MQIICEWLYLSTIIKEFYLPDFPFIKEIRVEVQGASFHWLESREVKTSTKCSCLLFLPSNNLSAMHLFSSSCVLLCWASPSKNIYVCLCNVENKITQDARTCEWNIFSRIKSFLFTLSDWDAYCWNATRSCTSARPPQHLLWYWPWTQQLRFGRSC